MLTGTKYVFTLAVSILGATGCASASAASHATRATSFGFSGRQCESVRVIRCVIDKDLPAKWCDEVVGPAIAEINEAAGRPVLVLGAPLAPIKDDMAAAVAVGEVPLWGDDLTAQHALGITNYGFRKDSDCIGAAVVRIDPLVIYGIDSVLGPSVARHELMHVLGAAHAEQGVYRSIMAPAPGLPNSSLLITQFDANALRTMYAPSFFARIFNKDFFNPLRIR